MCFVSFESAGGGGGGGEGDADGDGAADDCDALMDATVEYEPQDAKGSGPCPAVEDDLILVAIVGIQDPVRKLSQDTAADMTGLH